MTTNQIAWYDAQTRRIQAEEAARHNKEDERIRGETNAINDYSARATATHYMTSDSISDYSAKALKEHYINQDTIATRQAEIAERNAATNERQAEVAERQASVAERNADTNEWNAAIKEGELELGYHQLDNAVRIASINAGAALDAANIHAAASEYAADVSRQNTRDTVKAQRHTAAMQRKQEIEELREQKRHSQAVEAETHRANRAQELLSAGRNIISSVANEIAQQNANTNQQNAKTNEKNATTQRIGTIWSNVNDSVNTIWSNINNSINNANKNKQGTIRNAIDIYKVLTSGN